MRLFHTADWHLGRSLGGHSLQPDQEWLLHRQFLPMLREARPDALLLAGDVFDREVPPAEAVELLDDWLHEVVLGLKLPVVLIPGNHDEARRLSFGARLLAGAGLHIPDTPLGRAWEFADAHGRVSIIGAGYASPLLLAQHLGGATVADHDAAFAALAPLLHGLCPPGQRRVLVAHAFVAGGAETREAERGLAVGGTGQVNAAHFAGFHYVALGHLHRPQALAGGRLRYAGSPLAYSTAEVAHEKSATLLELDAAGAVAAQELPIAPLHPLRVLRGNFATLSAGASEDFVALELTDPEPVPEAQRRLAARYPRIVGLRWVAEAAPVGPLTVSAATARALRPLELFERFHQAVRGAPLPEAARPVVEAAIAAAEVP
jgi:exonuclease SbcD